MYFLTAITIGIVGSTHCAGMCGPILIAINQGQGWKNDLLHHSGRILTYATGGALVGALGKSISFMGWQQGFSLMIGITMVCSVLFISVGKRFQTVESRLSKMSLKFSSWIHSAGFNKTQVRFLMGVGNGILPCGLVYAAIAGAATTYTPWDGALFMMAFGLGTMPVLLAVTKLGQAIRPSLRNKARKLIPVAMLVMGLLLIARGSDLGISHLSPKAAVKEEISACE